MTPSNTQDLRAILEFQAIELRRLVKDNERLNKRVDRLIEELAAQRELQRQEITARREDQQSRIKVQEALHTLLVSVIEAGGLDRHRSTNGATNGNGNATVDGTFADDTIAAQPQPQNRASRRLAQWMLAGGLAGGVLGLLSVVSTDPVEAAVTMLAAAVAGIAVAGAAAVIRTLSTR